MGRLASAQGFQLETDAAAVAGQMLQWQEALTEQPAAANGKYWWLESEKIGIKLGNEGDRDQVRGVDLAMNPGCKPRTIEINMPSGPGTVDGYSQVGRDPEGRLWLFRQGRLQRNDAGGKLIDGPEFSTLTGLNCAFQTPLDGKSPARWWFQVCRLDVDSTTIRSETIDFVRRCQQARDAKKRPAEGGLPAGYVARARRLQGKLEPVGHFVVPPKDGYTNYRLHAKVINALIALLDNNQIPNEKLKSVDRYEIDLSIGTGSQSILVEAKTGALANDIETGVGQLTLYPHIFSELQDHKKVLLLPAPPAPTLAKALCECGVDWHSYDWTGSIAGEGEVRFSEAFTALCGVGVGHHPRPRPRVDTLPPPP